MERILEYGTQDIVSLRPVTGMDNWYRFARPPPGPDATDIGSMDF